MHPTESTFSLLTYTDVDTARLDNHGLEWIEQGLTSHQTHYMSYWDGYGSNDQTNSVKALKEDQASILSGPPQQAHNNTTTMQNETKTHKIHT